MYDATLYAGSKLDLPAELLSKFGVEAGRYAVATLHRAGNTDNHDQLGKLIDYLRAEAQAQPIVFPVHPRTRLAVQAAGLSLDGLVCCPHLGYLEMANLVKHSCRVYTDSGGLQKEAYFFRVPCVTLRDETEWVETVQAGWNRLWCEPNYLPRREIADYGDGTASQKIVEELTRFASSTAP